MNKWSVETSRVFEKLSAGHISHMIMTNMKKKSTSLCVDCFHVHHPHHHHQYGHAYLIDDGVQGAEQQKAPPPDQVLAQRHHVTLLLILVPRLCSLGHGAAQLMDVRQELPGQGVAGATHV